MDDDELTRFILCALAAAQEYAPDHAVSTDDLLTLCDWAQEARIGGQMLDMVLDGTLLVTLQDGEPMFRKGKS